MDAKADDLEDRVHKFQSLELPGQPPMMHVGTFNLVNDLWREVHRLRSAPHPAATAERAAVIEECAKVADRTAEQFLGDEVARIIARYIRALAEQPRSEGRSE